MLDAINDDLYCSGDHFHRGKCCRDANGEHDCYKTGCSYCHRKYPTPEQYKEEYGEDVPANFPVWWFNVSEGKWNLGVYDLILEYVMAGLVVCACTPFGKPDDRWRPE